MLSDQKIRTGWIKLYRSMLDWEWYSDKNTKIVFLHILLKANYESKRWEGHEIKRGSYVTSNEHLAKELNLGVREVRTALSKLEKSGEIDKQSTSRFTIINVLNYNDFQDNKEEEIDEADKQETSNRQTSDKEETTTKKDKNRRNKVVKKEMYCHVIDYLNKKAGTRYKDTVAKTVGLIESRIKEGFVEEDFFKVIDNKVREWKNNKDMRKFLRPETLFGTKFEGYLNQKEVSFNDNERYETGEGYDAGDYI